MLRAFAKNRAALLALAGLLLCLCFAMLLPTPEVDQPANPLPDDPDVQQIDRLIRTADLTDAKMAESAVDALLLRWISDGRSVPLTFNHYSEEQLITVLRALRFDRAQPIDWDAEALWLSQYGKPTTLRLFIAPGSYLDLYCWQDCREVWCSMYSFDPAAGGRWSATAVYRDPLSAELTLWQVLQGARPPSFPEANTPIP